MCLKAPTKGRLGVPGGTAIPKALPLCSLVGAGCLQRGGCERERGDDIMLTSSVRCGSFRHASNGPNGTILRDRYTR